MLDKFQLKWFSFLPDSIKVKLFRSRLKVTKNIPEGVIFKVADNRDEWSAAFNLLNQFYRDKKSKLKFYSEGGITKFNALPSTKVIIAKKGEKVLATLSLILDNPFGLPIETCFDISQFRNQNLSYAEVTGFAISSEFTEKPDALMLALFKFAFDLSINKHHLQMLFCAIQPSSFDFFKSVFLFESFNPKISVYELYFSRPVIAGMLDLRSVLDRVRHKDMKLYQFFTDSNMPGFQFPESVHKHQVHSMTPEDLNYFFNSLTNIFSTLTNFEKKIIRQFYMNAEYEKILPAELNTSLIRHRSSKRYPVELKGRIKEGDLMIGLDIRTVSHNGIGAYSSHTLEVDRTYSAFIETNPGVQLELVLVPVWSSEQHKQADDNQHENTRRSYGFIVKKNSQLWSRYVVGIANDDKAQESQKAS